MADDCPICFEPLSNLTTRVITECCNNTLHLECLKECEYKCPLCRSEALKKGYVSIPVEPETSSIQEIDAPPLLPSPIARLCRSGFMVTSMLFMITYICVFVVQIRPTVFYDPPPPPPPLF